MIDLLYTNEGWGGVVKAFPHAKVCDASDDIHDERMQVDLPDADKDAYLKWAIKNGFGPISLMVQFMMHTNEGLTLLKKVIDEIEAEEATAFSSGTMG